jgi:hypothetical protein
MDMYHIRWASIEPYETRVANVPGPTYACMQQCYCYEGGLLPGSVPRSTMDGMLRVGPTSNTGTVATCASRKSWLMPAANTTGKHLTAPINRHIGD